MTRILTPTQVDLSSLDRIADQSWAALAQRRIYFGHQSVGDNIIAGIRDIMSLRPHIRLRIIESADPRSLVEPVFAHSRVGSNGDPESKIMAFAELMSSGAGERVEIAMFKLCYVDIEAQTDPERVFEAYRRMFDALEVRYPKVRFVHITTPLTMISSGAKASLKTLLGRPLWGYEQNQRRETYNERMRSRYGTDGRLIDLAELESTLPDGSIESFCWRNRECRALAPMYTDDGGHLGAAGRVVVAKGVLSCLAMNAAEG